MAKKKSKKKKILIENFEQTCYACPSQWEGVTEKGEYIYIRYRWGYLRITVDRVEIYGESLSDDGWDGLLDEKDLLPILKKLGYEIDYETRK